MHETATIPPALTAEEWRDGEFAAQYGTHDTSFQVDHKGRVFATTRQRDSDTEARVVILNEAADAARVLPKVAALALHGQTFGFTREDVEQLESWDCRDFADDNDRAWLRSLADRIAALLPPEG